MKRSEPVLGSGFPRRLLRAARKTLYSMPWVMLTSRSALSECAKDFLGIRRRIDGDVERDLEELARWLCRAQDSSADRGVARSYTLVYKPFFDKKGWLDSYPETTGYIIPTFFDYAHFSGVEEYRTRAIEMADWECEIQLESGAVMGGTVAFEPTPAVFNTGQVLLGWCRAYAETGRGAYLAAAKRAGDYLVTSQDPDGAWRRGSSRFAAQETTVYNTRVSWGLAALGELTGSANYTDAARRNVEWAVSKQTASGWYRDNCLDDADHPLVHTIAYAIQGILETGLVLEESRFIDSAVRAASAMVPLLRSDGSLAGRYDESWKPSVSWSCLTGNMQMSIVWSRLHLLGLAEGMDQAASTINAFNRSCQDPDSEDPGRRGGVKGAYPIYGAYGTLEYLNWAAKFTMDALLMEKKSRGSEQVARSEASGAPIFFGT